MSNSELQNQAEKILNVLKQGFLSDLPGRLDDIENLILGLPKKNSFDTNFPILLREIHSIKGIAGTYGVHVVTSICHSLEDRLSIATTIDSGVELPVNDWLKYIDLIRQAVEHAINDETIEGVERALFSLNSDRSGKGLTGLLVTTSKSIVSVCNKVFVDEFNQFSRVDDGYHALGRVLREKFDYLVTSNEINGLNGVAFIAALRLSDSENKHIPVVLLTSNNLSFTNRLVDPDYVVVRDANFVKKLSDVKLLLSQQLVAK